MAIIIPGLLISGLYALIAVGFTMIYGVGRVENLAHGVYAMLAAYTYYACTSLLGMPTGLAFLLAILTSIGASVATYKTLIKLFRNNPTAIFISTIVLALILQYIIDIIFTPAPRNVLPIVTGVTNVLGVSVSNDLLVVMGISWAALAGLLLFVKKAHMGRATRAISDDPKGAVMSGINIERVNLVTWIWAGALVGLAGIFFGSYTLLIPSMWVFPLIISFAIVIVGGLGSIEGSILAAYIIGISETAMMILIAEQLRGAFSMGLMIIILVVRPRGLLGKEM